MKPLHGAKLPKKPTWATEIPERRPKIKYYSELGHAKNAIIQRSNYSFSSHWVSSNPVAKLFKWNEELEDWELVYELGKTTTTNVCKEELSKIE